MKDCLPETALKGSTYRAVDNQSFNRVAMSLSAGDHSTTACHPTRICTRTLAQVQGLTRGPHSNLIIVLRRRRFSKLAAALGGLEWGDVLRLSRRSDDRTEVWLKAARCGEGGSSGGRSVFVPRVHRHVYPRSFDIDRLPEPARVSADANGRLCRGAPAAGRQQIRSHGPATVSQLETWRPADLPESALHETRLSLRHELLSLSTWSISEFLWTCSDCPACDPIRS